MEKLTVVSGFLFFIADIFAIASLANPEWIITDVAGNDDHRVLGTLISRPKFLLTDVSFKRAALHDRTISV